MRQFFLSIAFLAIAVIPAASNAQIIVEVGGSRLDPPDPITATDNDHAFLFQDTFTFTDGVGSATISVSDETIGDFTFDISIELTNGIQSVDLDENPGNNIFLSAGTEPLPENEFANGDIFTITVDNVTNDVVFDGFTDIGTSDTGSGEGFSIGGIDYIRDQDTNGDTDPRNGVIFADGTQAGPTLTVTSIGTSALRGVALQFRDPSAVVVGDFDGDGDVDCDDLDGYVGNLEMAATGALAPLDFDGDGLLSLADANSVITLVMTSNGNVGTFPGDLNCDGTVNVLGDAFILVGSLGSAVSSYSEGDINFDGTVNVLGDAFILVGSLGLSNNP